MPFARCLAVAAVLFGVCAAPALAAPTATVAATNVTVTPAGRVQIGADVRRAGSASRTRAARITLQDADGHVLATGVSRPRASGRTLHHQIEVAAADGDALRGALAAGRRLRVHVAGIGAADAAVATQLQVSAEQYGITTIEYLGQPTACPDGVITVQSQFAPPVVDVSCAGLTLSGPVPGVAESGSWQGQSLTGAMLTGGMTLFNGSPTGVLVVELPG